MIIIAHMMKSSRLSPCFLYNMRQKAGEEPGNEATYGYFPEKQWQLF